MDSQNKHTRDGAALIRLLPPIALTILLPVLVIAAGPDWWTSRGVIDADPGVTAKDYAAVNQGQLKNMAKAAVAEFDVQLPGGAGEPLHNLVNGWSLTGSTTAKDYATVNLGQLKALSKPFYDRLNTVGMANGYPWSGAANDYAMANIGQVKNLFSFNPALFPQVSGPTVFTIYAGGSFSYVISASNSPTSYAASGLPASLTLSGSVISGSATTAGVYSSTFTIINASGTNNVPVVFNVLPSGSSGTPVINSSAAVAATAGKFFAYQITASKNPTGFFVSNGTGGVSGTFNTLPAGLNVDPFGGLISGTISGSLAPAGTYFVNLLATNSAGSGSAPLMITLNALAGGSSTLPVITSTNTATGTSGTTFSFMLSGSNSPTGYAATGLPDGLTINGTTGIISGTPNASGSFTIPISIQNVNGTTYGFLSLTINPPPAVITSSLTAEGVSGHQFDYIITANNNPITFFSGTLPSGLQLNAASGEISGTPASTGTYNVSITGSNSVGNATGTLQIQIHSVSTPTIISATSTTAVSGKPFDYSISAWNSPTGFGASSLPKGLEVNTSTGEIRGIVAYPGQYSITLSATNVSGTSSASLLLNVVPQDSGPSLPAFTGPPVIYTTGSTYISFTTPVVNGAIKSGTAGLPSWLSIDGSTHVISGTTPSGIGTYLITLSATNSSGTNTSQLLLVAESTTGTISSTASFQKGISPLSSYFVPAATILKDTGTSQPDLVNQYETIIAVGNLNATTIERGLVGFDLSLMPSDAVVTSGSVTLYVNPDSSVSGTNIDLYQATTQFYQGAASWTVNSAYGNQLATALVSPDGNSETPVIWASSGSADDFVDAIQGAVSSGSSLNLMLRISGSMDPYPSGTNEFLYTFVNENEAGEDPPPSPKLGISYRTSSPPVVIPNQTIYATQSGTLGYKVAILHSGSNIAATGLPTGLSIDGSGMISGSVSSSVGLGAYNVGISGSNGIGTGTGILNIVVGVPPSITGTLLFSGTAGQSSSMHIASTGGSGTFGATGLPDGLEIDPLTGQIYGTTGTQDGGAYAFTVNITNAFGTGSLTGTWNITPLPPAFGGPLSPAKGTQNAGLFYNAGGGAFNPAGGFILSAGGTSGTVPAWLAINGSSGIISGTPTVAGTFGVTVSATNASGTATAPLYVVIDPAPAFSIASGTVIVYDQQYGGTFLYNPVVITTSWPGGGGLSFSGSLPDGLDVDGSGNVSVGSPIVSGTYIWTPTVTLGGSSASGTITFVVTDGPQIMQSGSLDTAYVGMAYDYWINSGWPYGNAPADSMTATGLPSGISGDDTGADGTSIELTGTPTASGTYVFNITAINSSGTNTAPFVLNVVEPLSIANGGTSVYTGTSFSYTVHTATTVSGESFALIGGTLPTGVTFSSTGTLSGTPKSSGSNNVYNLVIQATGSGTTFTPQSGTITLTVLQQPLVATGTVGTTFTSAIPRDLAATNFVATGLPSWASLDYVTGTISGTPDAADFIQTGVAYNYLRSGSMATGTTPFTLIINAGASDYSGTFQAGALPDASYTASSAYIVNDSGTQADATFNSGTMASGTMQVGRTSGTTIARGLLAFDLTSIPPNAIITSAKLELYSVSGTGQFQTEIHQSVSPFVPASATWNNNNTYSGAALSFIQTIPSGSNNNIFYGTTAFTQAAQQSLSNTGKIYLTVLAPAAESGTATAYVKFATGTASPSQNPKLTVTYSLATPSLAPSITSSSIASGTVSQPFLYTITASNPPCTFSSGTLPAGLTLNSTSGVISGTVTSVSSSNVVVHAVNASGTGSKTIAINIDSTQKASGLSIVSGNNQYGTIGKFAALPLIVQASGSSGPMANTLVTFATSPGHGYLATSATSGAATQNSLTVITDGTGKASVYMMMPGTPSAATVVASAGTATPVSFLENAVAETISGSGGGGSSLGDIGDDVPVLSVISGQNQVGGTNATLPNPIVIQAVNHAGQPAGALPLSFVVTNGTDATISLTGTGGWGGTLSGSTDSSGQMAVYLHTGTGSFIKVSGSAFSTLGVPASVYFNAFTQTVSGSITAGGAGAPKVDQDPYFGPPTNLDVEPKDYVENPAVLLKDEKPEIVMIKWTAPAAPTSVVGYVVQQQESGGEWRDLTGVTSLTSIVIGGTSGTGPQLLAETDYEFRVISVDSFGKRSNPTAPFFYGFPLLKGVDEDTYDTHGEGYSSLLARDVPGKNWGRLWSYTNIGFYVSTKQKENGSVDYHFELNKHRDDSSLTWDVRSTHDNKEQPLYGPDSETYTADETKGGKHTFDLNQLDSNEGAFIEFEPKIDAIGSEGQHVDETEELDTSKGAIVVSRGASGAGSFTITYNGVPGAKGTISYSEEYFTVYDSGGKTIHNGDYVFPGQTYSVVANADSDTVNGVYTDVTISMNGYEDTAFFVYNDGSQSPDGDYSMPIDESTGPKYRKIAMNGLPLSDEKPQHAEETDQEKEETFVDALTLGLRHSTTDVYLPVNGSDFAVSARRDARSDVWNLRHGLRPHEEPDRPFGVCWTSNLAANIHFTKSDNPKQSEPDTATVTDEGGGVHAFLMWYALDDTAHHYPRFFPRPSAKNEQTPNLETLTVDTTTQPYTYVFKRKFGATLLFQPTDLALSIADDRKIGSDYHSMNTYARLVRAVDRLGNAVNYQYQGQSNLVPSVITVDNQPDTRLYIQQQQVHTIIGSGSNAQPLVTAVWDAKGNKTTFGYTAFYDGSGTTCELTSVVTAAGTTVSGTTLYGYNDISGTDSSASEPDLTPHANTDPGNTYLHADLASITDPLGKTYTISYQDDHTKLNYMSTPNLYTGYYIQTGLPRNVTGVKMPDNTEADFYNESKVYVQYDSGVVTQKGQRRVRVVDATGFARTYRFENPLVIPIPNLAKFYDVSNFTDAKMICYQSLNIDYGDRGSTYLGTERFEFDISASMALSKITDFSGNVTIFEHGNAWSDTTYLALIGSRTFTTLNGSALPFNGYYGDPTKQIDALSGTKTFQYDQGIPSGVTGARIMTDVTDEEGRHTHYDVDALERRTKETIYTSGSAVMQVTDFEYGDPAHPSFMTKKTVEALGGGDPAWTVPLITQYVPDSDGRVLNEIADPNGLHLITAYSYDANGNKLSATDPKGNTTWFYYDARNRLVASTFADGSRKRFVYDARGNKTAEFDERNIATLFHYDQLNRVDAQARDIDKAGSISFSSGVPVRSGSNLITSFTYNNVGSKLTVTDPNGYTTTMTYDDMQRMKTTVDALSGTTTLDYGTNSGGNAFDLSSFKPTKSTDPRGVVTNVAYDALYRPVVKSIVYDPHSPPAATTTVYDKVGNPTGVTDPLGHQTRVCYDALNRPTRTINADNTYAQTSYTSTGLKWRIRDELWNLGTPYAHTTETEYDGVGRVVSVIGSQVDNGYGHQRRPITRTRYDAAGNVAATISPLCQEVDFSYDARNRKIQEFDPVVADAEHGGTVRPVKTWVYDAAGRVIATLDPRGNAASTPYETDTTYDDANRPIQVQMPAAPYLSGTTSGTTRPTTNTTYDKNGNILTVTDPNTHVTTNQYDVLNRLTSTVDAASITVSYEYDQVGNRTKVTDGNGNITVLTYDGLNRNTTSTDAGGNTTTFKYDGVNKVQRIDAMRQVTNYLYDTRNRLQSVVYVSGNTSVNSQRNYSYDAVGNLLSVSEPGKSGAADTAYTYDALNRAITETSSGVTHNYTLDLLGNRLKTLYGGPSARTIVSTYDALNRLSSMSESSGTATPRVSGYAYDLNSNVQTKTLPNGDMESGSFDALNRMYSQVATGTTSGTLYNYIYWYDLTGNVTSVGETYATSGTLHASARTVTNTYDAINRLQVEGDSLSGTTSYTYDNGNNRTKKVIGSGTTTYTYNTLNQLVAYNDIAAGVGTALTYDVNGNRITRVVSGGTNSGTDTYSYDFENRLVGLVKGSGGAGITTGTYAYGYDYRTRRILRDESRIASGTSTRVVFSGGLSVQEIDSGTTPTVEYVRGSDYGGGVGGVLYTLRSGTPSYTHENKRGDVVAKTNGSGSLTYQAAYQAFGTRMQEAGSTTDRQKANTKDEDPTGLLDEGFRYRDLEAGVFLTKDPEGFVDGPNVYTYVRQNPWTSFDPEGLADSNNPSWMDTIRDVAQKQVDNAKKMVSSAMNGVKEIAKEAKDAATSSAGEAISDYHKAGEIADENLQKGADYVRYGLEKASPYMDLDHFLDKKLLHLSDADIHALDGVNAQKTFDNSPMRGFSISVGPSIPMGNDIGGMKRSVEPSVGAGLSMDNGVFFTGGGSIKGTGDSDAKPQGSFSLGFTWSEEKKGNWGVGGQGGYERARVGVGAPLVPFSGGKPTVFLGLSFGIVKIGVIVDPTRVPNVFQRKTYQ